MPVRSVATVVQNKQLETVLIGLVIRTKLRMTRVHKQEVRARK